MSLPIASQHNDLFELEKIFQNMLSDLKAVGIDTKGLFLNADAGFDSKKFRLSCYTNDIVANIDFNKRNSKTTD